MSRAMVSIPLTALLLAIGRIQQCSTNPQNPPCKSTNDTLTCTVVTAIEGLGYETQQPRPNLKITCLRKFLIWKLDCTKQDVHVLNETDFSDKNRMLRSLSMSGCCIGLSPGTFAGFNNLEKLEIIDSAINDTDLPAFQQTRLPKLVSLSLSRNNISLSDAGLESETFSGLPNMTTLDLSHNKIQQFKTVLHQTLSELNLGYNGLKTATISDGKPIRTCYIDYSRNQIRNISAQSFQNIQCDKGLSLKFSGNSLMEVSGVGVFAKFRKIGILSFGVVPLSNIGKHTSLCNLLKSLENKEVGGIELVGCSLTDHDIADGNTCFQSLTKVQLRSLNLSWNLIEFRGNNYLQTFFKIMSNVVHLEKLDLSANDISSAVNITVTLRELQFLDLSKNYIPRTPDALGFLNATKKSSVPKLKTLHLKRAFDKTYPMTPSKITWFQGLEGLERLVLSDNDMFADMTYDQFSTFFDGVPYLTYLNMADTDFGRSNSDWLLKIRYPSSTLTKLDLSFSFLTDLHMPLLEHLQSLEVLDLRSNRLGRLIPDWFDQLQNLTTLKVSDNKICYVDTKTFDVLPKLTTLELGNNAFGCDCSTGRLAKWLHAHLPGINITNSAERSRPRSRNSHQQRNISIDFDQIFCLKPKYGENLTTFKPKWFCDHALMAGAGAGNFAVVVLVITLVLFCVFGTDIRYRIATNHLAFYTKHLPRRVERQGSREQLLGLYHSIDSDAFVCYDVRPEGHPWVKHMEDNRLSNSDMRVTLKHLLLPNETFQSQINEISPTCRCILLVVDRGFLDNTWEEIKPVLSNLSASRKSHCVLVLLSRIRWKDLDKPLQSLGKKGACYKWPSDDGGCTCCCRQLKGRRKSFLKELRMALRGFPQHTVPLLFRLLGMWCCSCGEE